jgi:hypothetical protein
MIVKDLNFNKIKKAGEVISGLNNNCNWVIVL